VATWPHGHGWQPRKTKNKKSEFKLKFVKLSPILCKFTQKKALWALTKKKVETLG
jgi:hypothetical protein